MKLPDVILLNGTSSVGKSALSRALQARLPFVRIGIDDFIWERVPSSWYDAVGVFLRGSRDDKTPAAEYADEVPKLFRAYHRAVRACVAEGLGVVVDDAIVARELLYDWVSTLDGVDVFFVGVHCAVEELILRERARGDRAPGTAVGSIKRVHLYADYDLEIDSTATVSSALAEQVIVAMDRRGSPSGFDRMRSKLGTRIT
jgi:chloramphenicol 3-O phosphotransferase